jgi:L-histidine N-alpha-methyltransferase
MRSPYEAGRFAIIDRRGPAAQQELKQEVSAGLTAKRKYLPSKYFYDSRGSALFEQICGLPEYYQTRTELSILRSAARSIMRDLKEGSLIDLGSGANWKIRHLLDAANGSRGNIRYVPIDVCETAIVGASEELLCLYPDLTVSGIVADFLRDPESIAAEGNKLITFFGGTIGNFSKEACAAFLRNIASVMKSRDRLLVGMDMVKDRGMIEAAYNDDEGVTAEFNKNILAVINRELHATFDLSAFEHIAFYNEQTESVEMHLRAVRDVRAEIADIDMSVNIGMGETIFTEISRKFRKESFEASAAEAGLRITRWYQDRRRWFGLAELKARR